MYVQAGPETGMLVVGGSQGGKCSYHACPQSHDHRSSHPYNTGTEQVGFSSTRQECLSQSAKRHEVLGESHEGLVATFK